MTDKIRDIGGNAVLLSTSLVTQAASNLPDPETVNNVMSMLTQVAILVITLWKLVKKPKPQNKYHE